MQPRKLRYLRVEDQVPEDRTSDLFWRLPVDYHPLSKWLEFTWLLESRRVPDFEILTADFNFEEDPTSPKLLTPQDPLIEIAPDLRWHPDLQHMLTSGILAAATLAGMTVSRDLPAGAAVHTSHKRIVKQDVASTMLVAQILLLCGEKLNTESTAALLSHTITTVMNGAYRVDDAFVEAYGRFRMSFLERCGIGVANDAPISIWVVWESLAKLLDLCDQYAKLRGTRPDLELNRDLLRDLEAYGLEIYDRKGRADSLHIASLFADLLLKPGGAEYTVEDWFLLDELAPARSGFQGGQAWRYLKEFETQSVFDMRGVRRYFSTPATTERKSVMKSLDHPIHRLLAVYWAWFEHYEDSYQNRRNTPFDPIEGGDTLTEPFPSLTAQCETLLEVIQLIPKLRTEWSGFDPKTVPIPLRSHDGPSILKALDVACNHDDDPNKLTAPLRYGNPEYSQRRVTGVETLLSTLVDWGALEFVTPNRYLLLRDSLGDEYPIPVDQSELAWRLGFNDLSQLARDILRPAGRETTTAVFLKELGLLPVPGHYRSILLTEFVRPRWWDEKKNAWRIPETSWPRCMRPPATLPHPDLLQERHFRDRASESMQHIVAPRLEHTAVSADIAAYSMPFHSVSGDYYQIWSNDPVPDGSNILILDATGKHQAAAQLVCEVHGFLKNPERRGEGPADLTRQLNDCLGYPGLVPDRRNRPTPFFPRFASSRTATMIAGRLDEDRLWHWTNAGHPKPIRVTAGGEASVLGTSDMALGHHADAAYTEQIQQLDPGDTLFLYSDGLTEELTTFAEREPDRLLVRLAANAAQRADTAAGILDALIVEVREVRTASHSFDDTTLIVVKIR